MTVYEWNVDCRKFLAVEPVDENDDDPVAALRSLLEPNGELLPLSSEDGTYWAYNCLTVVDAMDAQRSTADYRAPDRIVVLRQFVPRYVELAPIFKLPQWLRGSVLVTEQFVELVLRHGLTGLDLRPFTEL